MAAAPPPVVSPQPAAQPSAAPVYPPPAPGGGTGKWFLLIILAFAAGVGGTILVLWLTGDLWNSHPSAYPPPNYGSSSGTTGTTGTTGTSPYGTSSPQTPTNIRPSEGAPPTVASLQGTWGPNCPASATQAATFYGDGTMQADGESGTWSLDGYNLTMRTSRGTDNYRWEMLGNDSAQVTRGTGTPRVVNRCP